MSSNLQPFTARAKICCKIFLLILGILLNFGGFYQKPVLAQPQNNSFVTIVNPVRGPDYFTGAKNPLETPKGQLEIISKNNLPATWLLRFDAYNNSDIASFFKKVPPNQELGIFFEITPSLTSAASVTYNQSDVWHKAKSVFLTGYTVDDRKKLITTAFEKFRETFGFYPKSVGAWWIDANSLSFMREKYGIVANLVVSDQFSTDDYQVWGMPFSTAFYPARKNALIPAQSTEAKIGVVSIQWAQRDPYNGYGPGVQESTYSVQANDYTAFHNLDFGYFEKLFQIYAVPNFFNKFAQLTIGLENTFSWEGFAAEYSKQIEFIAAKQTQGITRSVTMSNFVSWYSGQFPGVSPANLIFANDPLGGNGKVVWFNNQNYRIGWFYHPQLYGSAVRDLRVYNDSLPEQCYVTACAVITLAQTVSKPLDEATFGDRWTIDEGQISDFKIDKGADKVLISYQNAVGKKRTLELVPKDLFIDGEGVTVPAAILNVLQSGQQKTGQVSLGLSAEKFSIDYIKLLSNFTRFIIFAAFFFLLPGFLLIKLLNLELSNLEKFVTAVILGVCIFTLINFVFSWMRLPILANLVLVLIGFYQIYLLKNNLRIPKISLHLKTTILVVLIILGVAVQTVTVVKSGLLYDFGLGFWGPNGHDGIWHLSLAESLARNFPPQNPVLAGQSLNNYHYFYDFLLAKTHFITSISVNDLFFRYFPILISALFGLAVFILVKRITKSDGASLMAIFLSYFGGSFGWIVSFFREGKFGGESMFWANQAVSFLLNPPFAISVIIFLAGLLLFHQYLAMDSRGANLLTPLVISILWGSLIQFKAYAGILVLGSLTILTLWEILHSRTFRVLKILAPTASISAIVFLPNNFGAPNLLVFTPLWFVHTMAEYQDRLFWLKLANARNAYIQMGWWWKLILAEILGLVIFIVGNLGTKVLVLGQVFSWRKNKFTVKPFQLFITVFSVLAVLLPLLFIQRGTAWNTIQFFYYFQVVAGIFAAIFFRQLIRNLPRWTQFSAIALFCVLTVPTTLSTASQYLPSRAPARLPFGEFQALEFLKKQPDGIILTRLFDKELKNKFDLPLPLFAYETSAYVSAFSGKPTYVEDEINLEIIGANYKDRVISAKEFFRTSDENFQKEFLKKNGIKYIYIIKFVNFGPSEKALGLKKIFENDEVKIYLVL